MDRATAEENLRRAIIDHAEALGLRENDEMLDEFIIVAYWQRIEDDHKHRYTIQQSRSSLPNHVVVGLLEYGRELVLDDTMGED